MTWRETVMGIIGIITFVVGLIYLREGLMCKRDIGAKDRLVDIVFRGRTFQESSRRQLIIEGLFSLAAAITLFVLLFYWRR